jgi:hypothetical protein
LRLIYNDATKKSMEMRLERMRLMSGVFGYVIGHLRGNFLYTDYTD